MARLSSDMVEQKVLTALFNQPYHMKVVGLNLDCFANEQHRTVARIVQKYVQQYRQAPTRDVLVNYANSFVRSEQDLDSLSDALAVLPRLPTFEVSEFQFYWEKLLDYHVGRSIFDVVEKIKSRFETEVDLNFRDLRREIVQELMGRGEDETHVKRGYIYETARDRWETYRKRAAGLADSDMITTGISAIDQVIGGMMKTFVTFMYSKTGGGKTRTSFNIAFNNALLGRNVIYFTLEMAFDLIASVCDSRLAWVDSNQIIFGKLNEQDRNRYKTALREQMQRQLNIWLVDMPSGITTAKLGEEIEMYRVMTGKEPDLVIVDYASLVQPLEKGKDRSERYDNLFKEFHELARYQRVALLTAAMESRERSKADKKKQESDDDEDEGVDDIGLSNYIAPHCEIVARLKQTKFDALNNRLWFIINKYRYGKNFEKIPLVALWDKSYVGDRNVPGVGGVVVQKT